MRLLAFFALAGTAFPNVEVLLHYQALQRILAAQMFTQDGRQYVRGSKTAKCSYAYLENPKIGAEKGQLSVQAKFSGRKALDLLGRCVGLGDSFDVTILATPYYRDGSIAFKDVSIDSNGRDGVYIRGVKKALAKSFTDSFRYPLQQEARRLLEEKRADGLYRQEVNRFEVTAVGITPEALVLVVDFRLAVK